MANEDQLTDRMTDEELKLLDELEAAISWGFRVFVEVGDAIRVIKARRLYRGNYDLFLEYCHERWALVKLPEAEGDVKKGGT